MSFWKCVEFRELLISFCYGEENHFNGKEFRPCKFSTSALPLFRKFFLRRQGSLLASRRCLTWNLSYSALFCSLSLPVIDEAGF